MRDRINAPIAIAPPSRARPRARALATPSIRRKLFPSTVSRRRSSHRAFARVVTPPERPRRDPASRARVVESSHLDRRRRGLGLGFALGAHDHGRALRAALRRARGGADGALRENVVADADADGDSRARDAVADAVRRVRPRRTREMDETRVRNVRARRRVRRGGGGGDEDGVSRGARRRDGGDGGATATRTQTKGNLSANARCDVVRRV